MQKMQGSMSESASGQSVSVGRNFSRNARFPLLISQSMIIAWPMILGEQLQHSSIHHIQTLIPSKLNCYGYPSLATGADLFSSLPHEV